MLQAEFVASLDLDAEVRLGLHRPEDGTYVRDKDITITPAEFLGAPGGVGGDDGYLRIQVGVMVEGDEWTARRYFSSLSRELLRPQNYLRLQFDGGTPVQWYCTWRTTPGPPDITFIEDDVWQVVVQVDADPYAIGEEIQQGVTLSNDPTATGGVAVVLEEIVGDAPAPLVISGIDQEEGSLFRPLIAVTPLTEWSGLQFWGASDLVGVPGAFDVTDAQAFGGMAKELVAASGTEHSVVASVTAAQAGTYRLFARVRGTTAQTTLTAGGGAAVEPVTLASFPASLYFWADMGLYAFPKGNSPLEAGYTLAPEGDWTTPDVTLTATTTSGTASLIVNGFLAVPCELFESAGWSKCYRIDNHGLLGQRIDGEKSRVGTIPTDPHPLPPRTPTKDWGAFPEVVPGAVNVLHMLTKVQGHRTAPMTDLAEPLGTVARLNIRYRPRWLYFASA